MCCSIRSSCSASGMFSAAHQYHFEHQCASLPTYDIQHRSPRNQWSCFRSEYLQHMVMVMEAKKKNAWTISTECRKKEPRSRLTYALGGHRSLTVRMPSLLPWPQSCNFPLVVAAPQSITAKMTWGKADHAQQSMGRQLAPPNFPTPGRCTLPTDLLVDVAWILLSANAKGTGETPDCKRRQSLARRLCILGHLNNNGRYASHTDASVRTQNTPLIVYILAPPFTLTKSVTILCACCTGCIWFLSPWMRRQGCRIAASSFLVSAVRCQISGRQRCADLTLTYIHEHISYLRQPMAVKGSVCGFVMCNKLSDTT